jgi:ribosomal protein S18 acetylase RimI-like enzyme
MQNQIKVRPLKRGEENLWVLLGIEDSEKESRTSSLARYLAENPNLACENYLLAYDQDRVVGKMSGVLEATGYMATKMVVALGIDEMKVSNALFQYVQTFGHLQALSWVDRTGDYSWREILTRNRFSVFQDKHYYRKEIASYLAPYDSGLTYKSMKEVGEAEMLRVLKLTYVDNPNRNFTTPEQDFRSHQESAGKLFDPQSWFIAYLNTKPVGVLLPQRFEDIPEEGTLMGLGVVREHRGRGFGRILHAKGLEILSQQGAIDYIGSTDIENQSMICIFVANGCREIGIRTTHVGPAAIES